LRRTDGFTLLEVMVALAIFATLSVALYSAAGHIAGNSAGLTERSLAQWLADNRLNELRAGMRAPEPGLRQERIAFAGRPCASGCCSARSARPPAPGCAGSPWKWPSRVRRPGSAPASAA